MRTRCRIARPPWGDGARRQNPQTPLRRNRVPRSNPPTTTPCLVPSASRQVAPAGPTRVPPPRPAMVFAPTGPPNGPNESPFTVADSTSAVPPGYKPAITKTTSPRSIVANCERPAGNRGAPGPQEPVKNPDTGLRRAVSVVASRDGVASSSPPGPVLSDSPPNASARPFKTT